jgi:peptidoglycan hydrolase FlgJ
MNYSNINSNIIAQTIGSVGTKDSAAIDKVAKEFERMTIAQLLAMSDTDNDMSDKLFGGGAGEKAFKPFLWDEYAKGFVDQGGIGISDAVKREMIKLQEMNKGQ